MTPGIWQAIGAYTIWGFLPIYWKWLKHVPATEIICHRILWSLFWLLVVVVAKRQWTLFRKTAFTPRILGWYAVAAGLVGVNWLTYVWAVNAGFIVETSLGYFINPLLSVALGVVFFRERLRWGQWVAIGLAAVGVLYLTFVYGRLPWIALTLALSFGSYGLIKKIAPLEALFGLTLETGILLLPALGFLIFVGTTSQGAFMHAGPLSDLLLIAVGLVTAVPLLLFSSAARKIPLSLVGILQYIAPTIQFLIGVLIYKEPFSHTRMIGFGFVWTALIIFAIEGIVTNSHKSNLTPKTFPTGPTHPGPPGPRQTTPR